MTPVLCDPPIIWLATVLPCGCVLGLSLEQHGWEYERDHWNV